MTALVSESVRSIRSTRLWLLLTLLPWLLAAEILQHSERGLDLSENHAYRSPLAEALMGSSKWRSPQQDQARWRESPPPIGGWRTAPILPSERPTPPRSLELFPKYVPGQTSDFDFINREDRSLIKVFEFGPK